MISPYIPEEQHAKVKEFKYSVKNRSLIYNNFTIHIAKYITDNIIPTTVAYESIY